MRRRELVAGIGSVGVLSGAVGIVSGRLELPSFETDRGAAPRDGDSDGPIEIETIDARGSEAGTVTVPSDDVMVVNFFVTSCGLCQEEMPRLADARSQLVDDYGDDVTFMSVTSHSTDNMPEDELRSWWHSNSGNWTVGYDPKRALKRHYGAIGYPVTIVVDEAGEKHWEKLGITDSDTLVDVVESVLESSDSTASASTPGSSTNDTSTTG